MPLSNWRKIIENTGFILLSAGLILIGIIQGFQSYRFTLDIFSVVIEVLLIDAVASSFSFTAFFLGSSAIFFWKVKSSEISEDTEESNSFTCIIPTYKDSHVLENSVGSLLESEYRDFEIVIVCEKDDKKGIEAAKEFSKNQRVDYIINTKYPGSKAGAINYAAEQTSSDIVAIFDSDQKISENFLSKSSTLLNQNDVVQGRHLPRPDSLLESLAYYESIIFSYIVRQPLNIFTSFRLIGSRATLIRRSVFSELEGYREDTLTEDYDFAHKCYRSNIRTKELLLEPVTEEAAHSIVDWWNQRKRWMTGYFEVFEKSVRTSINDFKNYRNFVSILICGGSILGSILMITLVSKFVILLLLGAKIVYLLPIISILAISATFQIYDFKSGNLQNIGWSWIVTPLIFPLFSLITIKAFFEYLTETNASWYRVQK